MNDKTPIHLIAAIGKNRELGKGPDLIWRISEDLKHFKELTNGFPIIMGRKTFESIGNPLPKRMNIIVTRDTNYKYENCVVVNSIEQAIETAKNTGAEKIFVIGGGEIYKQTLKYAGQLDLTLIDAEEPEADVFFPEFEDKFKKISEEEPCEDGVISYTWAQFERKEV